MSMPSTCARDASRTRRGFSLVELLLAVFILAIGIISVAAIFPAGIAQQVQTKDAVYGPIVAEQAIGMLRSKLSQDDFGTFEQFGFTEPDRYRTASGTGFDPDIQDDALETVPGDWGWMRPSFILPKVPPLAPGLTPSEITQPEPLDGAIDVFSLRHTRDRSGFSELPGQDGEYDGQTPFFTSEFGKDTTANFYGELGGAIRSTDPTVAPFSAFGSGSNQGESSILGGIPFNRARYAILDPIDPFESTGGSGSSGSFDYRLDPGRAGRLEPLVTFTQGERSWPIGSGTPEYY